jgi:hypothetical protein
MKKNISQFKVMMVCACDIHHIENAVHEARDPNKSDDIFGMVQGSRIDERGDCSGAFHQWWVVP